MSELTKDDLLTMEYTELLRSEDTRVRTAADKYLGLRRVPFLLCFTPTKSKPNPGPIVLMRHQREIMDWIDMRENEEYMGIRGGILAAKMGLMKTSTMFAHILSRPRGRNPTLVVCDKTILNSWKDDLNKFFGEEWVSDNVLFLHRDFLGAKLKNVTRETVRKAEIVLTAYTTCAIVHKAFLKRSEEGQTQDQTSCTGTDVLYGLEGTRVVLDESQRIAGSSTGNYNACCALKAKKRICLTGTPIRNVDEDILSQLIFLGLNPAPAKKAWDSERYHRLGLNKVVKHMNYDEAGIVLPPREDFSVGITFTPEEREAYRHIETYAQDLYHQIDRGSILYTNVLEVMLRLRQFCVAPYLLTCNETQKNTIEKIGSEINNTKILKWLANKEGTAGFKSSKTKALMTTLESLGNIKVVVFSQFTGYLNLVSELLERNGRPYFVLTGNTKMRDREVMVKRFTEENKPWVMLLNYKTGGVGLNLQAGKSAIFCDYAWNESSMEQAIMRVWRSGQETSVSCYYLHISDSIEQRVLEIIEEKSNLAKSYQALGIERQDEVVRTEPTRSDAARLLGLA